MSEPKKMLSIEEERLERLVSAIALASTGELEVALQHFETLQEDSFGVLEGAMRIFLGELDAAIRQNREALQALAASKHEVEEKLLTIERQQEEIRKLSVPIIDVWEGILTLPLVGELDADRTAEVTERLLRRVADSEVDWVILDLTGASVVDTQTADRLLKLASAVELLGARCVLTGVGGNVAHTLVTLGISLAELNPMRTLREGLRYCLARRAAERARLARTDPTRASAAPVGGPANAASRPMPGSGPSSLAKP